MTAIGKATQPAYGSMFSGVSHLMPNNIDMLENHLRFATGGKVRSGSSDHFLLSYSGAHPFTDLISIYMLLFLSIFISPSLFCA